MTYWYLLAAALVCGAAAVALFRRFSYTDRDGLIAVAVVAAFVAVGCLGLFVSENLDRRTCLQRGERTGMSVQYEMLSGCYVRIDGQLIPFDRWVQVSGVNVP